MDDKKEKFLQDVIDLSVDGIIITDSSDPPVILYANPKIVELSEYDITEILGNTPSMFQGPRTNVETKKEIKTSMINREPYNGTILNYTKNGKPYMIDLSIKPITDNNGTDIFVAFLRNITDQIISSQEYEDNKALLESILDGCLSGIMTFRTLRDNNENICDFECILANEMATNLLNRDDLLGIKFSTLQSSFKDPELIDLMITSIEYESIIEKEVEYNHDVTIWLEISINKLDDGVVVTFNDITAKRMIEKSITENNKRMANILNNLPSFICLVNDQMEFSFINDHWREKLSIIPTNGQNYFDFMKRTFNITDDCVVQINMVLNGDRKNYSCEISANDDCYLLLWVAPIKINGNITGLTMMHVDITGQKQAEQALRESEKRFSLAVKGTNDGVWEWDIQNGTMWYSDVFASILGYDSTEDLPKYGKDLFKLIHPDDIRNLRNAINEHLDGNTDMLSSKHRLKNRHGDYRWVEVRAKAMQDDKKTICLIGTMTDVTDKLSMERKIYNIAHFDTLTGLPNRVLFYDRLSTAMKHSLRKNKSLALLYCDLDHFKHINDAFGHQIGDLYLKEIGSRLQQSLRAYDTVARLSGDEFAILMEIEHINGKNEALRIANRVIENIN
ncbi:MAG: PAS domain S-box protein, partial [Candidimonas sp.]